MANRLINLGLIFLGLLLIFMAFASLRWRFEHDSPILLYIAFLIDRFGYLPYRDIFDMNTPGTYLAYFLIGKLSGYTDIGVRCADLFILAAMLAMTWLWMRRFGRKTAWCGCILWGLLYLTSGPATSLQREYLLLLPIVAGLFAHSFLETHGATLRNAVVGLMFGISATMKPQAAIGLPLLVLFDLRRRCQGHGSPSPGPGESLKRTVLPALIGFGAPLLSALLYLWLTGALAPFVDMAASYWPLYGNLSGWCETISGPRRISYLIESYRILGGLAFWTAPAAVGAYVALYGSRLSDGQRRGVGLLLSLAFFYSIYPVFAGKFWPYHWLPLLYFLLQLSSLCLVEQPQNSQRKAHLFSPLVLAFVVASALPLPALQDALAGRVAVPKGGRVDDIAAFLRQNLKPGDTVQPLDWTAGAVHAMLISEARIATPFIYDFHFYHHVSTSYVQDLRRRFIVALGRARPRFVIQVFSSDKPWVWGADTTAEFVELRSLLGADYRSVYGGNGYVIHRRIAE